MGGFVSSTGYPIATKKQLADPDLGPEFLTGIKNIDAEDIMDKSKGDALSKGLAMVQGLWFTTMSGSCAPTSGCNRTRGGYACVRCGQHIHLVALVE
jgi:hypothetical protein